ncbi:MAG: thioredoxin domain-containing protein [Kofleriaceae bacterium]|nr:thioredoxin domain-containing protein [Kofleriaceae bacterium]
MRQRLLLGLALALAACGRSTPPAAPAPPPAKSLQVNEPGALVDVEATLAGDHVTVVDFWAESCGACSIVGGMLAVGVAKDVRVVIRKVDVGDGDTPVAHHYKVGALPHYRIYDRHKRLRYMLTGNDCTQASALARALADER